MARLVSGVLIHWSRDLLSWWSQYWTGNWLRKVLGCMGMYPCPDHLRKHYRNLLVEVHLIHLLLFTISVTAHTPGQGEVSADDVTAISEVWTIAVIECRS